MPALPPFPVFLGLLPFQDFPSQGHITLSLFMRNIKLQQCLHGRFRIQSAHNPTSLLYPTQRHFQWQSHKNPKDHIQFEPSTPHEHFSSGFLETFLYLSLCLLFTHLNVICGLCILDHKLNVELPQNCSFCSFFFYLLISYFICT